MSTDQSFTINGRTWAVNSRGVSSWARNPFRIVEVLGDEVCVAVDRTVIRQGTTANKETHLEIWRRADFFGATPEHERIGS